MPISLMYHDVLAPGCQSGFSGCAAEHYKLARQDFLSHLEVIVEAGGGAAFSLVTGGRGGTGQAERYLTFDDGGLSAYTEIADLLEVRGWRGHFFITTDRIGTDGFLDVKQIRELHARGHLIGSHSCSHPARISACNSEQLHHEWSESLRVLEDVIGERIEAGSVPGGFFSRRVARAAAASGLKFLFTSEPTTRVGFCDGCQLLGRFAIYRDTTPSTVVALVQGRGAIRYRQAISWNLKKLGKRVGGRLYASARERLLSRRTGSRGAAGILRPEVAARQSERSEP